MKGVSRNVAKTQRKTGKEEVLMMVSSSAVQETRFAEEFRKMIGQVADPDVRTLRERGFEYFAANGFPTPRLEDWKYTNVAEIAKREWTVGQYGFRVG